MTSGNHARQIMKHTTPFSHADCPTAKLECAVPMDYPGNALQSSRAACCSAGARARRQHARCSGAQKQLQHATHEIQQAAGRAGAPCDACRNSLASGETTTNPYAFLIAASAHEMHRLLLICHALRDLVQLTLQVVDLDALRELSWSGIPSELRPVCWRLLVGYLPPNRERRCSCSALHRGDYHVHPASTGGVT